MSKEVVKLFIFIVDETFKRQNLKTYNHIFIELQV